MAMKSDAFRRKHLLQFLERYEKQAAPIDICLRRYCKEHHALGAKDRRYLADTAYGLIRWLGLVDYLCQGAKTWAHRVEVFQDIHPLDYLDQEQIPLHIRCSFPRHLFTLLTEEYGVKEARRLALVCNTQAPTTIRANLLKTTRARLFETLRENYPVLLNEQAECAITFLRRVDFLTMDLFRKGLFEVQDAASQLAAALVAARPGQTVLDYCAGSAGKTLAFAPHMQNRGQIFLHDIRLHTLREAKIRLRRAGVQNGQIVGSGDKRLKSLQGRCDWVLVDAPCSATGTLRRKADMKWRLNTKWLDDLVEKQRDIVEEAVKYLKPSGFLVYVTCSILACENKEQLDYFRSRVGLKPAAQAFRSLPQLGGMDGFFGAVLFIDH